MAETPGSRKMETLRRCHALAGVAEPELARIVAESRWLQSKRGDVIWRRGAEVDFVGLIASGFVKMAKFRPDGTTAVMEIFGPGQIFGLMGVIDGAGCPLSAEAVGPLTMLRIPKSLIDSVYSSEVSLQRHVTTRTLHRLRQAHETMVQMTSRRVDARIAAVLLNLADAFGRKTDTGVLIEAPLSRQEIADIVGTTTETTIRVTSRWKKSGWITTHGRQIEITNVAAIESQLADRVETLRAALE